MIGHWTIVIFGGPKTGKSTVGNFFLESKNPNQLLHADKKDSSKKLKFKVLEISDAKPADQQVEDILDAAEKTALIITMKAN